MNYFFKHRYKLLGGIVGSFLLMVSSLHAAQLTLVAPASALANRQPIVVQIYLDPQQDTLSGIASDFSFPEDLFSVDAITTEGSVVSLWVKQPTPSLEKYLDNRTHITFEGIFPGGYSGVRSPYYQGVKPGILFSVTLIPKNEGRGTFTIDDVTLHAFNKDASELPSTNVMQVISVPTINKDAVVTPRSLVEVKSPTLTTTIARDPLINNNAWYLALNDDETKSAITKVFVVESKEYSPLSIEDNEWREVSVPYILLYQDRTKYVHTKILYSDNTYAIKTLAPVENSKSNHVLSRILVSIITVLFLLYFYGKNVLFLILKKP